jgi:hypothetical protein
MAAITPSPMLANLAARVRGVLAFTVSSTRVSLAILFSGSAF